MSEGRSSRRDTRFCAPRKHVIQILYSIMQINVRRIKLSLRFVQTVEKEKESSAWRETDFYVSSETKVYRGANLYLSFSLFLLVAPSNSIPRLFAHGRRNFWRHASCFTREKYANGEVTSVGSLRHVVHMSSGNGKYCAGGVACFQLRDFRCAAKHP